MFSRDVGEFNEEITHLFSPVASPSVPDRILLGVGGRCICGALGKPEEVTLFLPCKVYALTRVHACEIELQACNACPRAYRHYVGPDGREVGIFNLNNKLLFTHDLLLTITLLPSHRLRLLSLHG